MRKFFRAKGSTLLLRIYRLAGLISERFRAEILPCGNSSVRNSSVRRFFVRKFFRAEILRAGILTFSVINSYFWKSYFLSGAKKRVPPLSHGLGRPQRGENGCPKTSKIRDPPRPWQPWQKSQNTKKTIGKTVYSWEY